MIDPNAVCWCGHPESDHMINLSPEEAALEEYNHGACWQCECDEYDPRPFQGEIA